MIRKAVPADIPAIVALGIEALNIDPLEELLISPEKVKAMATECVSSANSFAWVCEIDGQVQGAVVALVHELMFYERKQASCIMFYCRARGWGLPLMRQFLCWARSRPAIKLIVFTLERNMDPRIGVLLKRLGLKTGLPVFIETR